LFLLSVNVAPLGSAAVSASVVIGKPVDVTVKDPAVPAVKLVLLALVIVGTPLTVMVKLCVAFGSTPLLAVNVRLWDPLATADVQASVPVLFLLSVNVAPLGNAAVSANVAIGKPVAVTVNDPAVPAVKLVLLALVMAGGAFITIMRFPVVTVYPSESVTFKANVELPEAVGTPLMTPEPEFIVRGVGKEPEARLKV
jgi:hypothetical protein